MEPGIAGSSPAGVIFHINAAAGFVIQLTQNVGLGAELVAAFHVKQ